jgi:hypothetical protein
MDGFKKIVKMKTGGLVKTPVTGDKKAAAPSKAATRPAFKGSDVAKEKSKPAGHKDPYIKSKDVATEAAPSAAIKGRNKKANGTVNKFKCGGKIVKKADGGIMDAIGGVGTQLKNNVMGTPEQNRIAQARMDMIARKKAQQAAMLQGQSPVSALQQGAVAGATPAPVPTSAPGLAPAPAPALPAQKKGGKVKGKC